MRDQLTETAFRQEVCLALLQNLEWMPKFESVEAAAEYVAEDVPTTMGGAIAIQEKVLAVVVHETVDAICSHF